MGIVLRPFIKYGLIALAIAAVLFGVYSFGNSRGHDAGYQEAWAVQQKTIDKMVTAQNDQNIAQNKKIADLEAKSRQDTIDLAAAKLQAATTRAEVITKYIHDNPVVAQSCGWDIPTVKAINDIINSDPINKAVHDYEVAHPGASDAPPVPPPATGVLQ